jgi:hypothetical protein
MLVIPSPKWLDVLELTERVSPDTGRGIALCAMSSIPDLSSTYYAGSHFNVLRTGSLLKDRE